MNNSRNSTWTPQNCKDWPQSESHRSVCINDILSGFGQYIKYSTHYDFFPLRSALLQKSLTLHQKTQYFGFLVRSVDQVPLMKHETKCWRLPGLALELLRIIEAATGPTSAYSFPFSFHSDQVRQNLDNLFTHRIRGITNTTNKQETLK